METIKGFDTGSITSFSELLRAYRSIGIQATNLSLADEILWDMVCDDKLSLFFAFPSNVISSGLREIAAQFIKDAKPKAIITTAGAIEEDVMKCLGSFYLGSFYADDAELRKEGINRIGNIYVPNERYEQLEKFLEPILNSLGERIVSVRELINSISSRISDEHSFLKAASDIGAEVFCPAITDGALGMQLYFHKRKYKEFGVDAVADMDDLAKIALNAERTGALILGGGVSKHYALGVNLLREGLNKAVYLSTSHELDASLSGANPREAVSWGKIKECAAHVHVWGDYSITFPLLLLSLHMKKTAKNKLSI